MRAIPSYKGRSRSKICYPKATTWANKKWKQNGRPNGEIHKGRRLLYASSGKWVGGGWLGANDWEGMNRDGSGQTTGTTKKATEMTGTAKKAIETTGPAQKVSGRLELPRK